MYDFTFYQPPPQTSCLMINSPSNSICPVCLATHDMVCTDLLLAFALLACKPYIIKTLKIWSWPSHQPTSIIHGLPSNYLVQGIVLSVWCRVPTVLAPPLDICWRLHIISSVWKFFSLTSCCFLSHSSGLGQLTMKSSLPTQLLPFTPT